jgi:hypothetical protein
MESGELFHNAHSGKLEITLVLDPLGPNPKRTTSVDRQPIASPDPTPAPPPPVPDEHAEQVKRNELAKQSAQQALAELKEPFAVAKNERKAMNLEQPHDGIVDPFSDKHAANSDVAKGLGKWIDNL